MGSRVVYMLAIYTLGVYTHYMKINMFRPQLGEMAGGFYARIMTNELGVDVEQQCAIQGPIVKINHNHVWVEGWNRTVRIAQAKAYMVKKKR